MWKYRFADISCCAHVNNFFLKLQPTWVILLVKSWLLGLCAPGCVSVLGLYLLIVIILASQCLVHSRGLSVCQQSLTCHMVSLRIRQLPEIHNNHKNHSDQITLRAYDSTNGNSEYVILGPDYIISGNENHTTMVREELQKSKTAETNLKILWADKTSLVKQTKFNWAYFARLTWPGSFLASASGNDKQELNWFPRLIRYNH